ncbi:hypothetical protein C8Q74DRAFT_1450508 [Fomes fomentarius]|nr:hypothetical protein C8Q74DRAFT_1450508 [Fomes fomentarius]
MAELPEPALPWDILREIAFICPRETCSTLMCTCAFFYHEAAASILGQEIWLHNEHMTSGFLKFLHAGKKPRYGCVRHLTLRFGLNLPPPDIADALAHAIALMTELVVVEIGSGELTLRDWPAIGDAIAFLPSLRQIYIGGADTRSWQLILSLQSSRLRSIKLGISDCETEEELSLHPVQLFGRWTSTLTELAYHRRYAPLVRDASPSHSAVYPMMRTLSIRHHGRLDPTPYIRAFPNLAHLNADTRLQLNDDIHEYRTSNIHSQRERQRFGPTSPSHVPGWRELIQFNGSLVDLYALALDCRISHVRLDEYTDDIELSLLSAVLADARPIHLSIYGFDGILRHPTDNLASILQTQGGSRLESLVVSCQIDGCTPLQDVASGLYALAASLAMLPGPFRRLQMAIYPDGRPSTYQSPDRLSPSSEGSPRRIDAANVDVENFVQIFVDTIPTLEEALVRYSLGREVTLRQAAFVRRGGVMTIGGTWVTDDPLDCGMFEFDLE